MKNKKTVFKHFRNTFIYFLITAFLFSTSPACSGGGGGQAPGNITMIDSTQPPISGPSSEPTAKSVKLAPPMAIFRVPDLTDIVSLCEGGQPSSLSTARIALVKTFQEWIQSTERMSPAHKRQLTTSQALMDSLNSFGFQSKWIDYIRAFTQCDDKIIATLNNPRFSAPKTRPYMAPDLSMFASVYLAHEMEKNLGPLWRTMVMHHGLTKKQSKLAPYLIANGEFFTFLKATLNGEGEAIRKAMTSILFSMATVDPNMAKALETIFIKARTDTGKMLDLHGFQDFVPKFQLLSDPILMAINDVMSIGNTQSPSSEVLRKESQTIKDLGRFHSYLYLWNRETGSVDTFPIRGAGVAGSPTPLPVSGFGSQYCNSISLPALANYYASPRAANIANRGLANLAYHCPTSVGDELSYINFTDRICHPQTTSVGPGAQKPITGGGGGGGASSEGSGGGGGSSTASSEGSGGGGAGARTHDLASIAANQPSAPNPVFENAVTNLIEEFCRAMEGRRLTDQAYSNPDCGSMQVAANDMSEAFCGTTLSSSTSGEMEVTLFGVPLGDDDCRWQNRLFTPYGFGPGEITDTVIPITRQLVASLQFAAAARVLGAGVAAAAPVVEAGVAAAAPVVGAGTAAAPTSGGATLIVGAVAGVILGVLAAVAAYSAGNNEKPTTEEGKATTTTPETSTPATGTESTATPPTTPAPSGDSADMGPGPCTQMAKEMKAVDQCMGRGRIMAGMMDTAMARAPEKGSQRIVDERAKMPSPIENQDTNVSFVERDCNGQVITARDVHTPSVCEHATCPEDNPNCCSIFRTTDPSTLTQLMQDPRCHSMYCVVEEACTCAGEGNPTPPVSPIPPMEGPNMIFEETKIPGNFQQAPKKPASDIQGDARTIPEESVIEQKK